LEIASAPTPAPRLPWFSKSGKEKAKVDYINGWHVVKFKRNDIIKHLPPLKCNGISEQGSKIPLDFTGVWWQDGVPSTEIANSWAQAVWEPGVEACRKSTIYFYGKEERDEGVVMDAFNHSVPCRGRATFFAFDHRVWAYTWLMELMAQFMATTKRMYMDMVCGGEDPNYITVCKLFMELPEKKQKTAEAIGNKFPLEWSMVRVNRDMWVRYSKKTGTEKKPPHKYYLKRIVDCSGKEGPYWSEFESGGDKKGECGPTKDVLGNDLNYNNRTSSKVPDKIVIRANKKMDQGKPAV